MKINQKYQQYLILLLIAVTCIWTVSKKFIVPVNFYPSPTPQSNPMTKLYELKINNQSYQFEKRITEAEQELGLSWRNELKPDTGMAFIYSQPERVSYWMRGMNFPIDIMWSKQGKIVQIDENIPAPNKDNPVPKIVSPNESIDLVLEVPAGFVKTHEIELGDNVSWQ